MKAYSFTAGVYKNGTCFMGIWVEVYQKARKTQTT